MDFEYSPHRSAGGTMHLLSPGHPQYSVDAFPSFKQIRRSLSRSPSKPSRFQVHTTKSPKQSPASPSALSRALSANAATDSGIKSKFTLRRNAPIKATPRRPSPMSPRRALSDGISNLNTASPGLLRRTSGEGQENAQTSAKTLPTDMRFELDNAPIKFDLLKAHAEKPSSMSAAMRESGTPVKSSPLKRSDGVMNLDQANLGSPRAKRRSLHSISFGSDFDIFNHPWDGEDSDMFETRRRSDEQPNVESPARQRSPQRRPFSLRRTTLQQRTSGPPVRPKLFTDFSDPALITSATAPRSDVRLSLDSVLPLRGVEPVVLQPPPAQRLFHSAPKPHPLSKALSPSSSTSSIGDENTPQLAPPQRPTRPPIAFSKSLPIGALRPMQDAHGNPTQTPSDSFETPEAYKMAKPLPAAFMSTGLISKRNRNAEIAPSFFGSSLNMPDTPSKKFSLPLGAATPAPASGLGKFAHPRHEFGSPTTPWSPHTVKGSPESFGKGVSIFGSRVAHGKLARRSSFLSIDGDGDDASQSPTGNLDGQASADELPPTPTKPASRGKGNSLRSTLFGRRSSIAPDTFTAPTPDGPRNQSHSITTTPSDRARKLTTQDSTTPSIVFTSCDDSQSPSFSRSRNFRQSSGRRSPSPLSLRSLKSPYTATTEDDEDDDVLMQTTDDPMAHDSVSQEVPVTPVESFTPPDPSRLSISVDHHSSVTLDGSSNSYPPATPTGPRDGPFSFSIGQGLGASIAGGFPHDVDTTLTTRFGAVSIYGSGEFSMVYRVEQPLPNSPAAHLKTPRSVGNVWAVKKSKRPYTGSKDRSRKMKEVQILRALRGNEHIIDMTDTWEMKNHLYIQTEFCENGNLKDFLSQAGYKARLDDFRIWKILLELSQGVKCIHDTGYIHLDLKPANVFIDWEGVLKIGDFGMASPWPAPPHLEGEGDREYIAPEVLRGRFDKPADVFALGMILLEIAGNIVLPDNGTSWQRLRTGDMSDLPSLTFSSESSLVRDESGVPVEGLFSAVSDTTIRTLDDADDDLGFLPRKPSNPSRAHELVNPPNFMIDPEDIQALDKLVQWMISPDPDQRPSVDQILEGGGVQWVESRRRAGATVFEGNFGPADDVLISSQDIEMLDI